MRSSYSSCRVRSSLPERFPKVLRDGSKPRCPSAGSAFLTFGLSIRLSMYVDTSHIYIYIHTYMYIYIYTSIYCFTASADFKGCGLGVE